MFLPIRKKLLGEKAFTLIELMISCLIIAVLISLAIPSFMTSRLRADEQKAVVTLHAYAQGQKSFWFDSDPNEYCDVISDLIPSYIDVPEEDGDWRYYIDGDPNTFTVTAKHLDVSESEDGLELVIDQTGTITRNGDWPY